MKCNGTIATSNVRIQSRKKTTLVVTINKKQRKHLITSEDRITSHFLTISFHFLSV